MLQALRQPLQSSHSVCGAALLLPRRTLWVQQWQRPANLGLQHALCLICTKQESRTATSEQVIGNKQQQAPAECAGKTRPARPHTCCLPVKAQRRHQLLEQLLPACIQQLHLLLQNAVQAC